MASIHGIVAGLGVSQIAQEPPPARKRRGAKAVAYEPEAVVVPLTHCVACHDRVKQVLQGARLDTAEHYTIALYTRSEP